MASDKKLPPIDHTEDKQKYEAYESTLDLSETKKCTHKSVYMAQNELRCRCGSAWTGPRIAELYEYLTGKK